MAYPVLRHEGLKLHSNVLYHFSFDSGQILSKDQGRNYSKVLACPTAIDNSLSTRSKE